MTISVNLSVASVKPEAYFFMTWQKTWIFHQQNFRPLSAEENHYLIGLLRNFKKSMVSETCALGRFTILHRNEVDDIWL